MKMTIVALFVGNIAAVACISLLHPTHIQRLADRGLLNQVVVDAQPAQPVSVSPAEVDYDRIIKGVTDALMLAGPQTDPLAQRSLPSQAKATAKQSK